MSDSGSAFAALSAEQRALLNLRLKDIRRQAQPRGGQQPGRHITRSGAGVYPLSFEQEQLWFLHQLSPESCAHHLNHNITIRGPLDVAALGRSLAELTRRHEALRTYFADEGEGVRQIVAPPPADELAPLDLRHLPEDVRRAEALRIATEQAQTPFDLTRPPLMRVRLLRLEEDEHQLLLALHHIITDWVSFKILFRELSALYRAFSAGLPSPLAELPIQFGDFAVWQREWLKGEALEPLLAYWKKQLAGAPPLLRLPTDRPRPPLQTYRGRRHAFTLPRALFEAFEALSRREGVTVFTALLAAFQTLLYRYTNQTDILVGTPVANRHRGETEGVVGFMLNTLVLRGDFGGEPTFRELLARLRRVVVGAYAHQELSFRRLVQELQPERNLSFTPLFQVNFIFLTAHAPTQESMHSDGPGLELPGLSVSKRNVDAVSSEFDLSLALEDTPDGLEGFFEYSTDLFDGATVARMVEHLHNLMRGAAADPDGKVSDFPILTDDERRRLLSETNLAAARPRAELCLHELFEAQARRTPRAVAVSCGSERVTYDDLNRRANRLAHYLRARGVGPETPVGILLERSTEMVVALLGVMKAGGAYVPLDPAYPPQRLAFILRDSRASLLLTQTGLRHRVPTGHDAEVVFTDEARASLAAQSDETPAPVAGPRNVAYVIYTSGSTGVPKGVMIEHRGAANLLGWAGDAFGADELSGVLASTSVCFDLSVFEIFAPLGRGGKVILVRDVLGLEAVGEEVTLLNTVPSALAELLKVRELPRSVKTVNLAGEPLTSALARAVYAQPSVARVLNLYGPSETTTYSTFAAVARRLEGEPSIGRPVDNTEVYVLGPRMRPVPTGVPGELYIGGEGLARGYLNRADMTAERFVPDPFGRVPGARLYRTGDLARHLPGGELEFLGRADAQVKLRGYRIELGEIEKALSQFPEVAEAAVAVREDARGYRRLVAYVAAREGAANADGALRSRLRETLPEYMIPSAFVALDRLPRTSNGKVDRERLPDPEASRAESPAAAPPRTEAERAVADIWRDVLCLNEVGVHDNFFELGGHSLLVLQVQGRLQDAFARDIPTFEMFRRPTVAALAEYLTGADGEDSLALDARARADSRQRLSQQRRELRRSRAVR